MRTAATGMQAQQTRVEVISNNLANVNTTGFKRSQAHFEDLLYQSAQGVTRVDGADAQTVEGIQIGRGTRLAAVQRVGIQGPLEQTGRPLDLAIEGDGFFQVQLPNGSMGYTRDGSFTISDQGTMVTHGGYTVVPGVTVPDDAVQVTVGRTGVVSVVAAGGETIEVGRIEMARFTNAPGLQAMGENIFTETAASGQPRVGYGQEDGFGRIVQGSLEGSNVEIVREMVDLITAMRAYEINSKAVQSAEQMAEVANSLIR
ncbi:MAG: flagellar basal-body rod protein FlgG [Gemmatimonadota bacterium]|nr:flagellar basal-body rod protein FlgG [Gemmatimonadota bacterium]MDH5758218.1 flagellar basal-body rod protein FlgG [Gemmatimonadota bacterium]